MKNEKSRNSKIFAFSFLNFNLIQEFLFLLARRQFRLLCRAAVCDQAARKHQPLLFRDKNRKTDKHDAI